VRLSKFGTVDKSKDSDEGSRVDRFTGKIQGSKNGEKKGEGQIRKHRGKTTKKQD